MSATTKQNTDRLIAIYGHELRGHLAPIGNAAKILQRSTADSSIAQKVAAIIERQLAGMTRLVDELIACSGDLPAMLQYADTAAQTITNRAIEMVAPTVAARSQVLSVRMPSEPIVIKADQLWLTLAVRNVLGNAANYTHKGGHITLAARRDEATVELSVRDTGVGLDATQLETIFNLHTRGAEQTFRPSPSGLGVGLHVARCVIEAHGGTIRATSEGPGRGSTFVIRIPRSPGCLAAAPALRA